MCSRGTGPKMVADCGRIPRKQAAELIFQQAAAPASGPGEGDLLCLSKRLFNCELSSTLWQNQTIFPVFDFPAAVLMIHGCVIALFCSGSLNRATVVVHFPSCFLSHCLTVSPQHSLCPPPPELPSSAPPRSTGQIGKLRWQSRSGGGSYLSQTDQEVCDGGVDGCCRSVTLAGARQTGPHGSGTVGLQTDGTWWVTNN